MAAASDERVLRVLSGTGAHAVSEARMADVAQGLAHLRANGGIWQNAMLQAAHFQVEVCGFLLCNFWTEPLAHAPFLALL